MNHILVGTTKAYNYYNKSSVTCTVTVPAESHVVPHILSPRLASLDFQARHT